MYVSSVLFINLQTFRVVRRLADLRFLSGTLRKKAAKYFHENQSLCEIFCRFGEIIVLLPILSEISGVGVQGDFVWPRNFSQKIDNGREILKNRAEKFRQICLYHKIIIFSENSPRSEFFTAGENFKIFNVWQTPDNKYKMTKFQQKEDIIICKKQDCHKMGFFLNYVNMVSNLNRH